MDSDRQDGRELDRRRRPVDGRYALSDRSTDARRRVDSRASRGRRRYAPPPLPAFRTGEAHRPSGGAAVGRSRAHGARLRASSGPRHMSWRRLVTLTLFAYPTDFREEFREQFCRSRRRAAEPWRIASDIVFTGLRMRAEKPDSRRRFWASTLTEAAAFGRRRRGILRAWNWCQRPRFLACSTRFCSNRCPTRTPAASRS